jgi:paraquat-inducible protein A
MITAASRGYSNCEVCGKLSNASLEQCPRCHARLEVRKADSIRRVLVFTITASILYIPANVLPITITYQLGNEINSTIIGGVFFLWHHGSYPVALVILIASVMVPSGKIMALYYLCWVVKSGRAINQKDNTFLYRVVEFIGRWSMVDVFVVALLVALIQLGGVLAFAPGAAALSFAGVVIITMFAASSFDPRLIWDNTDINRAANE